MTRPDRADRRPKPPIRHPRRAQAANGRRLRPSPLLLAAVAAAESLVAPVHWVAMTTHQLVATPDALRGRVTSAVAMVHTGALSVGTLAGGALIGALGPRRLVWLCTAWLLALAVATTANRGVRQAPPAQGILAPHTGSEEGYEQ